MAYLSLICCCMHFAWSKIRLFAFFLHPLCTFYIKCNIHVFWRGDIQWELALRWTEGREEGQTHRSTYRCGAHIKTHCLIIQSTQFDTIMKFLFAAYIESFWWVFCKVVNYSAGKGLTKVTSRRASMEHWGSRKLSNDCGSADNGYYRSRIQYKKIIDWSKQQKYSFLGIPP